MTTDVRLDEIGRFAGFGDLSDNHRARLAAIAHRARAEAGAVLMREGDDAGDLYVILSGSVDLSLARGERPFSTLSAGDLLGWSALRGPRVRVATAVATSAVELIAIAGEPLRRLCQADPAVGYAVMRAAFDCVSDRLSDARRALSAIGGSDAKEE